MCLFSVFYKWELSFHDVTELIYVLTRINYTHSQSWWVKSARSVPPHSSPAPSAPKRPSRPDNEVTMSTPELKQRGCKRRGREGRTH